MIPNLIDEESALMIFNTGKTINFLKKCCSHDYQIDLNFIDVKMLIRQGDSNTSFPEEFRHWLRTISDMAHRELMHVLFNKFKMKMHLDAVKRFMLMGQGEFIHNLMEALSKDLDMPAHLIYKHNLAGIVEGALRSSNTQYLNPEILNSVSFRLL
jgi:gamma-tubulin complex component 3